MQWNDFFSTASSPASRRNFLRRMTAVAGAAAVGRYFEPGVYAEELQKRALTPRLGEGPFYPDHLPLDTDNDLVIINDSITPAAGEVTHLVGKLLSAAGEPIRNATIEIWQVDNYGSYIHSHGLNRKTHRRDANFQGYGRFETASSGEYRFRTIKPVAYPGRTPHIHVKVSVKNREILTTQFFVKGEPRNERDGVYRGVRDPGALAMILGDFTPIKDSKAGELAVNLDLVVGLTPPG